ncbi:MAG: hypothetical protein KDM91_04040 [Verrucomicrobiae bacterium]|nr:hypothetical protein [Verrucomicrobiae bacterium]MCP5538632.1 hypothetical protein [Akkermansiaceae bacterium]MCP5550905.1 hypothetical protein [Akkermansiaceae bacterium]
MKRHFFPILFLAALAAVRLSAPAAETEPARHPGIAELRLVSDATAIRPGETIVLGLFFRHEPKFHTYWKSPGIVGVGALIEWKDLPPGFEPGDSLWPGPLTTKMAQLTAYGYETDTCILFPMKTPKAVEGDAVTFKAHVGWMACATTCHPGWHDFELTLPVSREGDPPPIDAKWRKVFDETRARVPKPAPEGWRFAAEHDGERVIRLKVTPPAGAAPIDPAKVYFFCDDWQVDSDSPQKPGPIDPKDGGFTIELVHPKYAPEDPKSFSGVLYSPDGWPGFDRPWMRLAIDW